MSLCCLKGKQKTKKQLVAAKIFMLKETETAKKFHANLAVWIFPSPHNNWLINILIKYCLQKLTFLITLILSVDTLIYILSR